MLIACKEIDDSFKYLIEINAHELTDYSIEARYPDDFYLPSTEESIQAVETADKVRLILPTPREDVPSRNLKDIFF